MQKITFKSQDLILHGTLLYPEEIKEQNPAVLFIHGWTSSEESQIGRAEALVTLGFICMTFDLGSHGESDGDREVLSRVEYLNNVLAAYDFLAKQKGVDSHQISVIGSSFGSYLGALLTAERNVKHLVLRVPANYSDEGFDEPHVKFAGAKAVEWRRNPLTYDQTRSLQAIHNYTGDILIVESELDELVPQQTILNYIDAVKDTSKLTHVVMKGAGHSIKDEASRKAYDKILVEWFSAILSV